MDATQNVRTRSQYLTFQLAGEEYALDIMQVREIIEYGTLTHVPQAPPSIRGVINLRGNVVPVIDLALKFTTTPSPITGRTCIIIGEANLAGEPAVMGVIADAVSKVVELTDDEILPTPAFGTGARVDYLRGMGRAGEKFLLLLDIDKVLSNPELKVGSTSHAMPGRSQPRKETQELSDGQTISEEAGVDAPVDWRRGRPD